MKSFKKQCQKFKENVVCYFTDFDLDSKHAFDFIELCLRLIKFNVFDPRFLSSPLKIILTLIFGSIGPIYIYGAINLMLNPQVYLELQFWSVYGIAVYIQIGTKMIAILVYSSQLRYLKKVITKDDRDYAKECDSFMILDRKMVRFMMLILAGCYLVASLSFVPFPLISKQEFFMFLPVQLPWTEYFMHPGYEINLFFSILYEMFILVFLSGKI
ncbi:unnamed protein product [Diamesa hyperborea]